MLRTRQREAVPGCACAALNERACTEGADAGAADAATISMQHCAVSVAAGCAMGLERCSAGYGWESPPLAKNAATGARIAAATAGSLRWLGLANACRPTRAPYGHFCDDAATPPPIYEFP